MARKQKFSVRHFQSGYNNKSRQHDGLLTFFASECILSNTGKSEVIKNNLNPNWVKVFIIDYELGATTKVALSVFDEVGGECAMQVGCLSLAPIFISLSPMYVTMCSSRFARVTTKVWVLLSLISQKCWELEEAQRAKSSKEVERKYLNCCTIRHHLPYH